MFTNIRSGNEIIRNQAPLRKIKFDDKEDEIKDIVRKMDSYDLKMLKFIKNMYDAMTGEKMDVDGIMNIVEVLSKYNDKMKYGYLEMLLHPEKVKCGKIPSPIPVPSCSFQLHNCITLSTNSSGNLSFVFNPYFLYDSDLKGQIYSTSTDQVSLMYLTSLAINNHDSLTGNSENDWFLGSNIGQDVPNVYSQYRLVSASVVLRYIGRLDITSGVCGGAIIFDDDRYINGRVKGVVSGDEHRMNNPYAKYGNFDLAMDSYYHQENLCIDGLRMLYFPVDNSYEEYIKLCDKSSITFNDPNCLSEEDQFKNGFKMIGYVMGAPASQACFKLDIYCNFECLPNPKFLNYMPTSTNNYSISSTEKKNAIMSVQKNAIMKSNEGSNMGLDRSEPSIWSQFARKFRNKIPGIMKLLGKGVLNYFMPTPVDNLLAQNNMEEDIE